MSLINIGLSGLNASSAAINTIGNNTANVDTAGYSRQQVHTQASPQILLGLGVGYIGTGTTISDVRRIYDGFLETQLQTSTGLNAEAVAYSTQASKTDSLLSDSTTGISAQLSSFFTKLQGVAANGTQSSDRAAFLTQASSLAGRMNSIAAQLSSQSSNINSQFTTLADNVNKLTTTIAGLNKQIVQDSVANTSPNMLLDARNEAVRQLNELVGARVVESGNNYDIYIGNGQALVSGSTASKLEAVPGSTDATQFTLQVKTGGVVTDVSSVLTGGSLGGLLRYRNEVLTPAVNELGRLGMVLSDQINTQLVQGINQKGTFGTPLFSDINSASAITQRSVGKDGNSAGSGNLAVTITDTSKLTADDYEVKVDVSNPGAVPPTTTFTVRRLPEGAVVGTGDLFADPAPTFDGFSLSLSGNNLAAGDTFKVTPTRNGASGLSVVMTDPQDLAVAAPLTAAAGASNSGTGAFTQPTLTTKPDIYDAASLSALQSALKDSTPMRLVMGPASNGVQSYTLVNAQGQPIVDKNNLPVGGSLLQGQNNTLKFNVGYGTVPGDTSFDFEMTVYGTPNANDTFNISLTGAGSSDNRNAAAIVDLQTARTVGVTNGSVGYSMSSAYSNLVSETGTRAAQGKSDVTATDAVLAQAKSARDSVSGVSLDEEAASLIKYQQYYTASSQIIKAAQTMFSTLINSI